MFKVAIEVKGFINGVQVSWMTQLFSSNEVADSYLKAFENEENKKHFKEKYNGEFIFKRVKG